MLPFIIVLIPLIAAILSLFVNKQRWAYLEYIIFAMALAEIVSAIEMVKEVLASGYYELAPYFYIDSLSALLISLIAVVGLAACAYSVGYLRMEVKKQIIGFHRVRQYFIFLNLFLFTMFLAAMSANPIMIWIAIEATTLSTAFLISFYNKPASAEAAWKYLIINSVGLLLGFFGTLIFLASMSGFTSNEFVNWKEMTDLAVKLDPLVVKIAFIFILVGYGTKMGLVPMHTWLPDAHSKASTPISGLLSGVLLNIAFFAILRFKIITDRAVGISFSQNLLIFFGLISIILPAFIILIQKNYKRLLAYSSIEHMGVMAIGFGFGGAGIFAALLHMVYHALVKSMLFLSVGNIFLKYSSTKIFNVRGTLAALPLTSVFFLIGIFAIIGMPPFGLFFTEFYILASGIFSHPFVAAAVIVGLTLIFIGFYRNASAMIFGGMPEGIKAGEQGIWTIAPLFMLAAMLLILSFYIPPFLKTLLENSAELFI